MTTAAVAPVFRSAEGADCGDIERLLQSVSLPTAGVAEMIAEDPSQFVVAHVGPELVAVAGVQQRGTDALLRSVAVRNDWRGKGLGVDTVSRALAHASARGITSLYLLTLSAERWFPRFGFTRIERRDVPDALAATVEFTGACPATAVVMHTNIGAHT